jgi:YesN/AraC family two-component response regulator
VSRVRIVIADDQSLFREGLRTLLSTRPEVDVVGAQAANGVEAIALVERFEPDVVLMDLRMPVMDGIRQRLGCAIGGRRFLSSCSRPRRRREFV